MLNGIDPIIIFTFYTSPSTSKIARSVSGIPVISPFIFDPSDPTVVKGVGVPIPIYLNEKITGVYVSEQSRSIDFEENITPQYNQKLPIVNQTIVNSVVTVNLFARKDSPALVALLAFSDMILQKVTAKAYSISYLNKSTTVFNGLLHGFNTSEGSDDDLLRITLQLSKANEQKVQSIPVQEVFKYQGAVPLVQP